MRRSTTSALILISVSTSLLAQNAPKKTAFTGDLGIISASGNTRLRTISVGDKITRTDGRWVFSQIGAYVNGATNGVSSANQLRLAARSDYLFRPRLSAFTGASFERNVFAGFKRRTDENLGLSWKALQLTWDSLSVDAGGVMTQEASVDGTSKSFPAARTAGAYKHSFSKASYFLQLAEYIPDLESSGEYRVNSESALVAPLSSHMNIKVGYVVRYNSTPPVGFGTTDRVLTTGVQVSW
jgi:putative salt-induced outer membrane protein